MPRFSDRSGDFTSYIVNIQQIMLTRTDGAIQVYPLYPYIPERVDLVQLGSVIEVLGAAPIATGTYSTISLSLDYSTAQVLVNVNGHSVPTTLIDASTGTQALTQTLTIHFDPTNPLVINNQATSLTAIDVDLAAGNTIDYSTQPNPTVRRWFTITGHLMRTFLSPSV